MWRILNPFKQSNFNNMFLIILTGPNLMRCKSLETILLFIPCHRKYSQSKSSQPTHLPILHLGYVVLIGWACVLSSMEYNSCPSFLVVCQGIFHLRLPLKVGVYISRNASDSWDILLNATRNHCVTTICVIQTRNESPIVTVHLIKGLQ